MVQFQEVVSSPFPGRREPSGPDSRPNGALARRGDEWIVDEQAAGATRAVVDRLLADGSIDLPAAVVIDAGVIRGRGAAIVEANEACGSGLYGCDPVAVLDVPRAGVVATARREPPAAGV